ncbi:MAG: ABC transporter permease [Deltaproteobacteria bacterium]|nr:ABC transporter permease [Deltaproteobacteria bacterium]
MISTMAWRNLWRHRRRTLLTAGSMGISVMVCIVMNGISVGFMEGLRAAVVDRQLGHVQLHHVDYPASASPYDTVPDASTLLAKLKADDGVTEAAPRVLGFGLFGGDGEEAATGMFMGVDPAAESNLTGMADRVTEGAWLSSSAPSAVIGYRLARDLKLAVGDELLVVTNALDGSIGDRVYPVVGIYKTTNLALDDGAMFPLPVAQELLVLDDAIHEIVLLTEDADTIDEKLDGLTALVGDEVMLRPWWEISPETVQMLGLQGVTILMFAVIIIGISAFLIINTLLMSVYERTREFGVLAAVGTRPRQIVGLVLAESFLLATLSALIGLGLGLPLDYYLATKGLDLGMEEGFQLSGVVLDPHVYAEVTPDTVIVPVLALFLVGVVGGLWPAIRASRLDPVTAIRQD